MSEETLWDRAIAGELWGSSAARTLESQFAATGASATAGDPQITRWLRQQNLITAWQAEVLETGAAGPFRLGDYWLEGRIPSVLWPDAFAARHLPTKYPVTLYFVAGDTSADLERWQTICERQAAAQRLSDPCWLRFYERVELPEYRFVVGERIELTSIADKLGRRGRTNWSSAVATVVRLATACEELRVVGIDGIPLHSRTVYFQSGGQVRVVPPVLFPDPRFSARAPARLAQPEAPAESPQDPADLPDDYQLVGGARTTRVDQEIFALGTLLFRMIRGESLRSAAQLAEGAWSSDRVAEKLAKYELPEALEQLLKSFATPNWRSPWLHTASFAQALAGIGGEAAAKLSTVPWTRSPDEQAYLETIRRWQPGAAALIVRPDPPVVIAQPDSTAASGDRKPERFRRPLDLPGPQSSRSSGLHSTVLLATEARSVPQRRKHLPWIVWSFAALAFLACFAAVYYGYQQTMARRNSVSGTHPRMADSAAPSTGQTVDHDGLSTNNTGSVEPPAGSGQSDATSAAWLESIVPDDGQHLWQSPTTGPPLDLGSLPLGPTIVAAFRPAEILLQPDSARMGQALGAEAQAQLAAWSAQLGCDLSTISQLVVAYYPGENLQLQPCCLIRFVDVQPLDLLQLRWQADGYQTDGANQVYSNGTWSFAPVVAPWSSPQAPQANTMQENANENVPVVESDPTASQSPRVTSVLAGVPSLVARALENPTANPLTGPLERLLPKTQSDRLVTLLVTRAALVSDGSDPLLVRPFRLLRPALDNFLPDGVQAIGLSVHWDDALFAELVCEATVDLRTSELVEDLAARIREARDAAAQAVAASAADPYWDRVRLRFDNMVADLARNTRVGAEQGQVLANAWLPLVAGHNLIAGTELVLAARGGTSSAARQPTATPTDLTELLQTRHTLRDANPPDLNILVDNLQTMIRDRFPQLPFQVEIRLSNTDLKEGGITRNQRPGPLELVDQTLEQILTAVVFGANPDKNATNPKDPLCKLVWVVLPPDDSQRSIILITTRDAVAKQGYTLPAPFLP